MRHTKFLFLLFFLCALQSCVIDYTNSPDSSEADDITSFRRFFEQNAPALVPVSFGESTDATAIANLRKSLPTRVSTFNIVPDWTSYRRAEHEDYTLLEVPLSGEIYNRATLATQHQAPDSPGGFAMEARVLSSRSFMLVRDDGKGGTPGCVVVNLIVENDNGGDIRFLENKNISGIVVFSTLQGRYLRSYHVKNGKWHPIRITPDHEGDERKEFTQFTLEYSPAGKTRGYSTREGGGSGSGSNGGSDGFGTGGSYVRCALCGTLYDFDKGDCPNNCGADIYGEWPYTYCDICHTRYNPLKGGCPNGCRSSFWEDDPWNGNSSGGGYDGGWGGGGGDWGGGGDDPPSEPSVAPKAKAIFRNSNMTIANWNIIENMLDKIIQNCMGEALYNKLRAYLGGATLKFEFVSGNAASFSINDSSIKIGMDMAESNVLFHEMMHALQAYFENTTTYKNALLNHEIEAHYAQYLYLKKLPEFNSQGNKWENIYRYSERGKAIKSCEEYVDEKGRLIGNSDMFDVHLDYTVVPVFRSESGYSNFAYNSNRNGIANFSVLSKITQNCN